ncbi:thiosulfate:glutathione sulfurtransferase-like [Narcine bancroftii]|uniref:thiosulfate:glutathione sulfurtransferase-like n=1 Tax=Narcine bancroftii TaxID=1343680 RepID=UPI003831B479
MSGTVPEITCEELKKMMMDNKVLIIDVRSPGELEKGTIVGSINIPVNSVEEKLTLDPDKFQEQFGIEKPKETSSLVFHCQKGLRGACAVKIAQTLGYTSVQNLAGGFQQWTGKE